LKFIFGTLTGLVLGVLLIIGMVGGFIAGLVLGWKMFGEDNEGTPSDDSVNESSVTYHRMTPTEEAPAA